MWPFNLRVSSSSMYVDNSQRQSTHVNFVPRIEQHSVKEKMMVDGSKSFACLAELLVLFPPLHQSPSSPLSYPIPAEIQMTRIMILYFLLIASGNTWSLTLYHALFVLCTQVTFGDMQGSSTPKWATMIHSNSRLAWIRCAGYKLLVSWTLLC